MALPISVFEVCSVAFLGIHAVWNPPFFGRQAVEANVVDVVNRFDMHGNSKDAKQAVSLAKVRELSGKQPRPAAPAAAAAAAAAARKP